ncbi:MAG: DMT family transporter [Planctomycetota bacterium]
MHLLLPFLASILFVGGLICLKRVGENEVSPVTVLFASNIAAAFIFPLLWFLGGELPPWGFWWQPLVISILYMMGLLFTFAAINRGDVSVATPVLGVKVLFVTILLAVSRISQPSATIWYAALMATLGIALIQYTGTGRPRRIVLTILLAMCAASSYATFDVLVQRWAPAWGAGRFLPVVFGMVGILSAPMIPWTQWEAVKADRKVAGLLALGSVLIALQAVCIVSTLSIFGDAARVNVVYGLRGLWSVLLAWVVARIWGGAERHLSRRALATRFAGAGLLTAAVVAVVLDS